MAYIVVSDVHLGSEGCNHSEFCDFLKWADGLERKPETIIWENKNIEIKKPEKLILLGDILELWDPIDGNRDYVIRDCIVPFSLLSEMNCEKVYVVGNHDDSLGELEEEIDHVMLPNGEKIDIWDRHYPESLRGVQIGCRHYFFLHGHQFDPEQAILAKVSDLIGENWDPLDWFQGLFNITFTKKHWKFNLLIFAVLLIGGGIFWEQALQPSFLITLGWAASTGFFALSSIPGVVARSQRGIYNSTKPVDKTAREIVTDNYYKKGKDKIRADRVIFGHTHFASSYLLEDKVTHVNKLFINSGCWYGKDTEFEKFNWDSAEGKDKDKLLKFLKYDLGINLADKAEIIKTDNDKTIRINSKDISVDITLENKEKATIKTNEGLTYELKVREENGKLAVYDGKMRYANTFVYIDNGGAYIMRWRGCSKIECIEAFPE